MALFKFTKAMLENREIDVYNKGQMRRDFTYIDDLVTGIELLISANPNYVVDTDHLVSRNDSKSPVAPFRVVNIGRKAVFPVAGFGTRFLPATKAMPKELLPIVDKPLIQYAAEEAIAAGIDTLIFVTGRNKRAIEDHFDANNELETMLRAKGKDAQADMVRNIIPEGVECIFVRQAEQLGLGHAVLCAERAVGGDPFAVLCWRTIF
jgi:hypothetical protein